MLLEDWNCARCHLAFFEAGAEVAITASYQASFEGFAARGLDEPAAAELMRRSVDLARLARDEHGSGYVAASVGPYGAVLGTGAEFTGDYRLGARAGVFHRRRLEVLDAAGADVLAVDDLDRGGVGARPAAGGVARPPGDRSHAVTGGGSETARRSPRPIVAASDRVFAVGVNCTAPRNVHPLIEQLLGT